jgi:hypothetical protein
MDFMDFLNCFDFVYQNWTVSRSCSPRISVNGGDSGVVEISYDSTLLISSIDLSIDVG